MSAIGVIFLSRVALLKRLCSLDMNDFLPAGFESQECRARAAAKTSGTRKVHSRQLIGFAHSYGPDFRPDLPTGKLLEEEGGPLQVTSPSR
jgi:hypothetical protein